MRLFPLIAGLVWLALTPQGASAQHSCDPIGDEGWRTVPSVEVTAIIDGPPYQAGADWLVERTLTLVPLCNYYNAVGNYSLRSYQLDPVRQTERVMLCRAGVPIAPYAGPCPPK